MSTTVTVAIFHNCARDAEGRNLGFFGYKPEQPFTQVHYYDRPEPASEEGYQVLLNEAYFITNVGHEPEFGGSPEQQVEARSYRDRRLRSLSVGDLVGIGTRLWAVADFGFEEIENPPAALAHAVNGVDVHGTQSLFAGA